MRNIFIILFFISTLFASNSDFLKPEDAFKSTVIKENNNIIFRISLDKSIYVYDEYLKVTITPGDIDITNQLKIKEAINYHDFMVHFDTLQIVVPDSLLKEKNIKEPYEILLEYQGCSKAGLCYSPMDIKYSSSNNIEEKKEIKQSLFKKSNTSLDDVKLDNKPKLNETDSIAATLLDGNTFVILATFFGFGLLLALTPCIFPMIPILSSIIVRQSAADGGQMSSSRGFMLSLVYVLAMSVAYTIAGVMAGLFGANIQAMLQNPYVIVSFSAIFVALAFSMFGYYEIGLPNSWMSKINKASDNSSRHGGFTGVAVMGFLSALIVGPCVAPPLAGALIYIGQTGDALLGGSALFVMSLGMGLPLLAIGIGAGKYMPKPGGWMTTVSKVFGVVMLAIAIWMLERIIPFVVTVGLFSLLGMGSAFYLLKNGNKTGRFLAGVLMLFTTFAMMYTLSSSKQENKLPFLYVKNVAELDKVIAHSTKPIMIDFWATWCVSCKEFDNITFKNKTVKNELSKYLLIKIDVTKNTADDKALMKKFNLFGPPAMIFYKDGIEEKQKRIIGYKSPKEFMDIIK
ncbi:MAG: protein-disulfide reductase DsbD [Campylobacterota bacterium]|nr:protein-disulfide reductase DsbD [Campylobacterota bacterium]